MTTAYPTRSQSRKSQSTVPAYGPIEAALGYVVFYVFVTRATPTLVEVVPNSIGGITPSLVRLGLALALWLVLAANVIEQVRRQIVAFREGYADDFFQASVSTGSWMLGYLALLLVGSLLAVWTFDRAVDTGISLIRMVVTLDVGSFVLPDFVVMVAFFIAFGAASRAVDRLVIGGIRELLTTDEFR